MTALVSRRAARRHARALRKLHRAIDGVALTVPGLLPLPHTAAGFDPAALQRFREAYAALGDLDRAYYRVANLWASWPASQTAR